MNSLTLLELDDMARGIENGGILILEGNIMMKPRGLVTFLCLIIGTGPILSRNNIIIAVQSAHITAAEAANHVGEMATVCGRVIDSRYLSSSRKGPTFLNLDKPYPNHIFTVVIWRVDRFKFGEPEKKFRDKRICVTGKISSYRGLPQIIATDPAQIEMVEK
jgi:hypothetical protein